jgi:hypothetical protein
MWPWSNQGIASASMNVPQNMQQYFSGTNPGAYGSGDWRSNMNQSYNWGNTQSPSVDYSNYEDLIMNPEGVPNRLQNLERFSPVGDPDRMSAYTGEPEFIPGYNFNDAPNRPTNIKDWWANRDYWNNPAVKNPFEKAASGVAGLFKKLPSPMNIMRGMARNPLDPNSPNFNPMLQSQLENYSAQGWRVNEQGQALDGPLAGQNLVSGFGTNDVTAQLRKRLQKIRMRKMKQTDASMAKQQEILDAIKKQTIGENEGYTGTPGGNVGSGVFAKFDQSGKTYGPYSGGANAGNNPGMPQGNAGGAQLGSGMTTGQHAAFRKAQGGRVPFFYGGLASVL